MELPKIILNSYIYRGVLVLMMVGSTYRDDQKFPAEDYHSQLPPQMKAVTATTGMFFIFIESEKNAVDLLVLF